MITGGFQYSDAWKNYPICNECTLNIRNGYSYLQNNFNFKFYGLRKVNFISIENWAEIVNIILQLGETSLKKSALFLK